MTANNPGPRNDLDMDDDFRDRNYGSLASDIFGRVTGRDIFARILKEGSRLGKMAGKNKRSREWFRQRARSTVASRSIFESGARNSRGQASPGIGDMFFFKYDPKFKNELPYYDAFPLVFPIQFYSDGFLGINFHYLSYNWRAKLMDALYSLRNNRRMDASTKLNVTYKTLKGAAKYKAFQPCVKRYLFSHVKSNFIAIESNEWDIALFLDWADFKKSSQSEVWVESARKMS